MNSSSFQRTGLLWSLHARDNWLQTLRQDLSEKLYLCLSQNYRHKFGCIPPNTLAHFNCVIKPLEIKSGMDTCRNKDVWEPQVLFVEQTIKSRILATAALQCQINFALCNLNHAASRFSGLQPRKVSQLAVKLIATEFRLIVKQLSKWRRNASRMSMVDSRPRSSRMLTSWMYRRIFSVCNYLPIFTTPLDILFTLSNYLTLVALADLMFQILFR